MKPGKMPGGFNMNALMKQAQKMQEDMAKLQAELETREFTASAGGGAVKAVVCGKLLKSLEISPEVIDPEDSDMLCDLIMAAVNEAMSQCEEITAGEMQKITGGAQGLPF
ncbi:MAG: YbaB/EbfC family nucleoid-associated protein [Clostridiaceae bacterium]|nr:YbaB/EbfC family nucleoid-associated protein [Clostridiaceae bacterium]